MTRYSGFQDTLFFNAGELTVPGTTAAISVYDNNYFSTSDYSLVVTVTNINTSVVVRLDGSIDGTNYGPLISNTITENGTYVYNIGDCPMKFIRGNFLAETGGTSAVVTMSYSAR
jgi:hypothetical protein